MFSCLQHDMRRSVFAENLELINRHNAEHALGLHTFTLGVNKFADMTSEEFAKRYNGFKANGVPDATPEDIEAVGDLPDSVDWREKV